MAHYMPMCECGERTLSDLRSESERQRWADRLNDCWGYRDNGIAYWGGGVGGMGGGRWVGEPHQGCWIELVRAPRHTAPQQLLNNY